MKTVPIYAFLVLSSLSCFGASLKDAYRAESIGQSLRLVDQLSDMKAKADPLYEEIVSWLDESLYGQFQGLIDSEGILDIQHWFFQEPIESDVLNDFERELGLLCYLFNHARSPQLKADFLELLSRGERFGEAVRSAQRLLVYPQTLQIEYLQRNQGWFFKRLYRNFMETGELILLNDRSAYIKNTEYPEALERASKVKAIVDRYQSLLHWHEPQTLPEVFCSLELILAGKYHVDLVGKVSKK